MKRWVAAVASLSACAAACDDGPQSHVYVAMLYEPARACLDPSSTLAILGTPNGSLLCPPTCLVEGAPPAVGSARVYVSTMCSPYPTIVTDTSGSDPACAPALAAFEAGATCGAAPGGEDGGGEGGDNGGEGATDARPE